MKRNAYLRTSSMFAVVRARQPWDRKFRFMRDDQGHGNVGQGGASQVATTDNTGGNAPANQGDSTPANNGGQSFDLSRFWDGSDGSGNTGAAPSGSATPNSDSSGQPPQNQNPPAPQQQQQNQGGGVAEAISSMNFGQSVMTESVMKDLAEGKTDTFHTAMNQYGQQVATQTIKAMLPIMSQLRDQLRNEMKEGLTTTLNTRDNMADLLKAIPSANNPAVRPQVESIFNRAMTHTKGDRAAAIAMTKDMLRLTATTMGDDIGLPPRTAGDGTAAVPSNTNWLEELAGR